jgi:hypothetical protein
MVLSCAPFYGQAIRVRNAKMLPITPWTGSGRSSSFPFPLRFRPQGWYYHLMSTITFDTLKFVERLEKAGVTREQASAFADAQKEAFAEALDTSFATKTDIEAVRADITKLEARIAGEIALVKWMLGVVIAIAIANFAKQYF